MTALRIFSYLPNPRIMKATIAARLCGIDVEIRGDKPKNLVDWLWDFEAHKLSDNDQERVDVMAKPSHTGFNKTLYKTENFLKAHPFGTVPAAFSPSGETGIFESNSILRAVARAGKEKCNLYGEDPYESSRIDSFLDVSLIFARQSQVYLLALSQNKCNEVVHKETSDALNNYLTGMNRAMSDSSDGLVNNKLSIADICFVCEICQISRERAHIEKLNKLNLEFIYNRKLLNTSFEHAMRHFDNLCDRREFSPDIEPLMSKLSSIADQAHGIDLKD